MVPQASASHKRGLSHSTTQPEPKRKTLADRAGTDFGRSTNTISTGGGGGGSLSTSRGLVRGYSLKDVVGFALVQPGLIKYMQHTN